MADSLCHRPTLLIGYGRFGLETLRQFLLSTATRGVLTWEAGQGANASERHLRDLALLWLRDPFEDDGRAQPLPGLGSSRAELMRDLHQQIETLPESETDLKEAVKTRAEALLNAARRAGRDRTLPLGLDVVVLAHPHDRRTLGRLRPLLINGVIDLLHQSITQLHREAGADALNFVHIVDFNNYWERSEQAQLARGNFKTYVEHWQRRREEGKPTFGRVYLVDSHTPNGVRQEPERIDEISLFLEFLLFEGQRDSDALQGLYQARPDDGHLLATFGIRLLERSGGLLKRLAAARFGIGWLDYLGSERAWPEANLQALRAALEAYQGEALEQALDGGELAATARRQVDALAQDLEALPNEAEDWPSAVQASCEAGIRRAENALFEQVQTQAQQHRRQDAEDGPIQALRLQIEAALHDDRHPATLGAVMRELDAALQALKPAPQPPLADPPPPPGTSGFPLLQDCHGRYRQFLEWQLDLDGVRKWWPLFALLFGLGLGEWLLAWASAWPDKPAEQWKQVLYEAARWLAAQAWAANLAGLAYGGLLAFGLHRGVKRDTLRARRFWADPQRGRLADALRALSVGLEDELAEGVNRLQREAAANIRTEAARELSRLQERLGERRREAEWLRGQLRDFLDMYGLGADAPDENWARISGEGGIRYALEQSEDLLRISRANPLTPERFQSMQAERKPLKQWDERYSPVFLYPLRFIDELSEAYREPLEQELARPGQGEEQYARAQELSAFLRRHGGEFATAFFWRAQAGVPPGSVFCLLPALWLGLPGVRDTLTEQGVGEDHRLLGGDTARAYLLRLQIGVETACLTR